MLKKAAVVGTGLAAGALMGFTALRKWASTPVVLHVVPDGDQWKVTQEDGQSVETFERKKEAVSAARDLAHRRIPSQLVIHRSDGTIQTRHTYEVRVSSE